MIGERERNSALCIEVKNGRGHIFTFMKTGNRMTDVIAYQEAGTPLGKVSLFSQISLSLSLSLHILPSLSPFLTPFPLSGLHDQSHWRDTNTCEVNHI